MSLSICVCADSILAAVLDAGLFVAEKVTNKRSFDDNLCDQRIPIMEKRLGLVELC
jgi:hypothetical protein